MSCTCTPFCYQASGSSQCWWPFLSQSKSTGCTWNTGDDLTVSDSYFYPSAVGNKLVESTAHTYTSPHTLSRVTCFADTRRESEKKRLKKERKQEQRRKQCLYIRCQRMLYITCCEMDWLRVSIDIIDNSFDCR